MKSSKSTGHAEVHSAGGHSYVCARRDDDPSLEDWRAPTRQAEPDEVRWNDLERRLAKNVLKFLVEERHGENVWQVEAGVTLETLSEAWLGGMAGQLDPGTVGLYRLHFSTHLTPHFRTLQAITKASIAEYGRARLAVVKRRTLQKERSTLRTFLQWCHEQGYLSAPLDLPPLPRRAQGTAYAVRRRGKATELTAEECHAVIATLPAWSTPRGGRVAFPVRARFIVAYETSLRPATLDALSVPEHYHRGADRLVIPDDIDKARFGRELPLTEAARAALDSVAPASGLIFGDHDYRHQLDRAAALALDAQKAATFASYDFRHARLTHLAETGNLPGVAYMAGHKRVTTTAIYVKPGLRAANTVLGTTAAASTCSQQDGSRLVRALAECTAEELSSLRPPQNAEQLRLEWQVLANARIADLRARAQAEAHQAKRKRRRDAPWDDAALDELVLRLITEGDYSSQHQLRAAARCTLRRIAASLGRLTRAGLVRRESKSDAGPAPCFRALS